ncbi:hypothetical protein AN643_03605 [Candidatus Epulonipiscioides saccharophilum]|nr:hypothetical protein AN643_03605 [Epulopiscium sp. SCG-B10WGA-EpuloB]
MKSNPMIRRALDKNLVNSTDAMSIAGARNKSLALLGITAVCGIIAYLGLYSQLMNTGTGSFAVCNTVSVISGLVGVGLVIFLATKPHLADTLGMIYAVVEGIFVGSVTVAYGYYFDGVISKAMILTLLAIIFTLLLYNEAPDLASKIRKGVQILTLTIFFAYILNLVFMLFGAGNLFGGNSLLSIGISMFITLVAIANLMLDYDNIVIGARHRLPKYMESFFAVGLLVTVVWVYIEMLQLVAKMASRE